MINNLVRRTLLVPLAILFAAAMSGCKEKEAAGPPRPPDVEVFTVAQRDVPIYRDWVGSLEGDVNATISAQVAGYLISRNYTEGTVVTNGQVLFQIDPGPFQATLDKAKAQVEQSEAQRDKYALTVKRYRPLAATEAISQQELDDAVQNEKTAAAQVLADKAAVEQAQLNLNFTTIRSPVDGLAGLAKAQVGDLIGPNTGQLTTVTKIEPIRAYFSVSQQLVTQMQERRIAEGKPTVRAGEGPELELVLASGLVYPIKGRLRFANNQVDVRTGTIMVVGEFANPQMLLVPGMFVRVRALMDTEKNALLVPQRAVTDMQGQLLIAVVGADNKVNIRPVQAGERVGQDWVITGNVKAGDRVVAEGVQKVRDGSVVNPVPFREESLAAAEKQ
ncbi:MAG TPA: efflux RND transporter periplasmic adaptor subunit [Candidatus Acidoferrum sp.]|nr:efflux RND transporter periplasmic adaptor subunit [Candidatus Acidoferrum sp.]